MDKMTDQEFAELLAGDEFEGAIAIHAFGEMHMRSQVLAVLSKLRRFDMEQSKLADLTMARRVYFRTRADTVLGAINLIENIPLTRQQNSPPPAKETGQSGV